MLNIFDDYLFDEVPTPDDIFAEIDYVNVDDLTQKMTETPTPESAWGIYDANNFFKPEKRMLHDDPYYFNFYNKAEFQKYIKCNILRNHDCMWTGHCASKDHRVDEPRNNVRTMVPNPPVIERPTLVLNKQVVCPGRSLLLKTAVKQQQQQQQQKQQQGQTQQINQFSQQQQSITVSPDSPPMSDDEECKTTETLQILRDVINSCDIEDGDTDLYDYFEDEDFQGEEESVQETKIEPTIVHYARDNDHSYHKDENASMHLTHLGIETPSDSEEEIDVVTEVKDKHNTRAMALVSTLPNNPTSMDKRKIQKTMATAINKKPGIKTILPLRKPIVEEAPVRRKGPERATKRGKARKTQNSSPYKRRVSHNNSNDEQVVEPSQKRDLHNNMERQRRIDLRNAFDSLRNTLPGLHRRDRTAKVVILREAAKCCRALTYEHESMCREEYEVKRKQARLAAKVRQLRIAVAAKFGYSDPSFLKVAMKNAVAVK